MGRNMLSFRWMKLFNVEMTAREKDSVNYSINEYSALAGEYTRNINYFNIEMQKGEVVEGVLPAYDKAELEKDDSGRFRCGLQTL